MKTTRRSEAGMAILETALALPLLLFVLFAIAEISVAFARYQIVLNAAREGARAATLFRANCDPTAIEAAKNAAIDQFNGRIGMGTIPRDNLVVSDGNACTARTITVTVRFTHEIPFTSGLGAIAGGSGQRGPITIPITGVSTMPNERRRAI